MSELIPTPIVDKNGRQTTVHRKSANKPSSSALNSSKPVISQATSAPNDPVHTIRGKPLHGASLAVTLLSDDPDEQYRLTRCTGEHEWRKSVEVPNSVLYGYLRMGADIQDAAALYGLGVMPDDLPNHPKLAVHVPGRLGRLDGTEAFYVIQNRKVISRFEAAGFPAVDVEKAVANKVQDWFLDKGLDESQLLTLFSKKKYQSVVGTGNKANDRVVNAFVRGNLPLTVLDVPTSKLKNAAHEVMLMKESLVQELASEPELFGKLIMKTLDTPDGRIQDLYALLKEYGPGVMGMQDPYLCSVKENLGDNRGSGRGSFESGVYYDQVHQIIRENDNWTLESAKYEWWGGLVTNDTKVINADVDYLRRRGFTPQETYEGLVLHKLTPEQMIVGKEDTVPSGFAGGAL
jgi:hypothetical protein